MSDTPAQRQSLALPVDRGAARWVAIALTTGLGGSLLCADGGLMKGAHQLADRGRHAFIDAIVVALKHVE